MTQNPWWNPLAKDIKKIDICLTFCMLYYGEDVNLTEWKLMGMLGISPIRVEEGHL